MDGISFRRAGAASCGKLLELCHRMEADEHAPEDARTTRAMLERWFAVYRAEVLFAERAGEVVGFVLALPHLPTPNFPTALYAAAEYVAPELRRSGLGRTLFGWFADRAHALGRDRLMFCCLEHNVVARAFVESMGATVEGERLWTSPATGKSVKVDLYTLPV